MYIIKRNGKKVPKSLKNKFAKYDQARCAIRKWLRKYEPLASVLALHSNPNLKEYGFSIVPA